VGDGCGAGHSFLFGMNGLVVLFAFISFASLREFVTLTDTRRSDHWILLGMFGIIIPFQYWLVWTEWYGLFTIFIPVYCSSSCRPSRPCTATRKTFSNALPRSNGR
jgi:predicted CDP-diglyceride synthetase/phosphatidate cytidylyltransferase